METYVDEFLKHKENIEGCSGFTIKSYGHDLKLFFEFLDNREASKELIEEWLGKWKNRATKNRRVVALRSFWSWLLSKGKVKENIMADFKTLETDALSDIDEEVILTDDEYKRVIEACRKFRDKVIFALLLTSGLRARELLRLRVENLNLKSCRGSILRKGSRGGKRPFMFSRSTSKFLNEYIRNNKLGTTSKLFDITYNQLYYIVIKTAEIAGFSKNRVHPHIFRHMWATRARREKLDGILLGKLSGWSKTSAPKMFRRYTHIKPEEEEEEYQRVYNGT